MRQTIGPHRRIALYMGMFMPSRAYKKRTRDSGRIIEVHFLSFRKLGPYVKGHETRFKNVAAKFMPEAGGMGAEPPSKK